MDVLLSSYYIVSERLIDSIVRNDPNRWWLYQQIRSQDGIIVLPRGCNDLSWAPTDGRGSRRVFVSCDTRRCWLGQRTSTRRVTRYIVRFDSMSSWPYRGIIDIHEMIAMERADEEHSARQVHQFVSISGGDHVRVFVPIWIVMCEEEYWGGAFVNYLRLDSW